MLVARIDGPSRAQSIVMLDFRLAGGSLFGLHHLARAGESPRQARFLVVLAGLVGRVSRRFQTCRTN